jgi:hypothetical protein
MVDSRLRADTRATKAQAKKGKGGKRAKVKRVGKGKKAGAAK